MKNLEFMRDLSRYGVHHHKQKMVTAAEEKSAFSSRLFLPCLRVVVYFLKKPLGVYVRYTHK